MQKPLYILYGGPSSEHEVSFGTRDFFLDLYAELNPLLIKWRKDFLFEFEGAVYTEAEVLALLEGGNSCVLLASHGEYVEDGYIQEKFEQKGIRFTGSNSSSCRLAQDKYRSMDVVKDFVSIPKTYKTSPGAFDYAQMVSLVGSDFPIFVKPLDLGSSVDVHKITSKKALLDLVPNLTYKEYLFQQAVEGIEVSLGTVRDNAGFIKLFPTEIIPSTSFFDYEAKYTPGVSEEITPARISEELTIKLQDITNRIHDALGLGYYSRSDFIITNAGEIYYLETNALPGMTKTSLVPQQLRHADKLGLFKKHFLENLVAE